MTAAVLEWLNILLRWAHVMFGILWIGTSFFFIWLDASLKKRAGQDPDIAGESWMVHGGGFYLAEKYMVAPERLPDELHWFKYEAYFTWVTGILLLVVIYYFGAEAFLIDRDKAPLEPAWAIVLSAGSLTAGWFIYDRLCKSELGTKTGPLAVALFAEIAVFTFFYHGVFSDRAAFLHVGALIGTIMAVSVFAVIIPNQKKVVADLLAGRRPDPALGKQARQRSLHNNYLTLPVVFMMISNHYPIVFGHPWSPLHRARHRDRRRRSSATISTPPMPACWTGRRRRRSRPRSCCSSCSSPSPATGPAPRRVVRTSLSRTFIPSSKSTASNATRRGRRTRPFRRRPRAWPSTRRRRFAPTPTRSSSRPCSRRSCRSATRRG